MEKLLGQPTLSFDEFIKRLKLPSKFDFKALKIVFDRCGIQIKNSILRGNNLALTILNNEIHFNISKINQLLKFNIITEDDLFFLLSHELCHYLRLKKYGKVYHLEKLTSNFFFQFSNFLINEEIFCDRFARLFFYIIKKHRYKGNFIRDFNSPIYSNYYLSSLRVTHKKLLEFSLDYNKVINDYFILVKRD